VEYLESAAAGLGGQVRAEEVMEEGCICKGNWRAIVKESEQDIGKQYSDRDGKVWTFFGVVHSDDDYYYGMWREGHLNLLSCVGSLALGGYEPVQK
jgi:hypothetical protein